MTHLSFEEHVLDNGLRVVLAPDDAVPIVGLALYYDVGSRDEEQGRSGFAHLFEHMMFQGSDNVDKAAHFGHIQGVGGSTNATTSDDRTNYYCSLPANQLELGLWLEADRMRSLQVTPENFENQRQTVMEERRQRVDDAPYGEAMVKLGEASFSKWAYAHPVIGYWEDLEACTYDEVVAFHRAFYRPNNATLVLSGDLDPSAALETVKAWYGDIEPGPRPAYKDVVEPRRAGVRRLHETDELARLPALFVNHQCPGFGHPDFFAFEVIETALVRGPSSRAHRRLVVDEQLAVQISGGYDAKRGPGLFRLAAVTGVGGSLEPIRVAWQEELDRFVREPMGQEELDKVLGRLRSSTVYGLEGVLGRALQLGRAALFCGDPGWENRYLDAIAQVQPEDLQRVAAEWLDPDTWVSMEVHPA
jgi:zinc protease